MRKSPSQGDFVPDVWFNRLTQIRSSVAIEDPNCIGLELDHELLDDMLDGFLTARNSDGAVVLGRREFTLHEDVRAFYETWCQLREAIPKPEDSMPLSFVFPLAFCRPSTT